MTATAVESPMDLLLLMGEEVPEGDIQDVNIMFPIASSSGSEPSKRGLMFSTRSTPCGLRVLFSDGFVVELPLDFTKMSQLANGGSHVFHLDIDTPERG